MILNHTKTAFRNFRKRWPYFLINLFGLAIGISAFLILMGYAHYEESYETMHQNRDTIYSIIMSRFTEGDMESKNNNCPTGMASTVKKHVEGVKYTTRFQRVNANSFFRIDSLAATEKKLIYADQDFFEMFSIKILKGEKDKLLAAPFSLVLTEEKAKKYFGNQDPLGKIIRVGNDFNNNDFTVTGVVEKLPDNSEMQFDCLASFESMYYKQDWFTDNWFWWAFPTYISLEEGYTTTMIESQFPSYVEKYKPQDIDSNYDWQFTFQPLAEKHLNSNWANKSVNINKAAKKITMLKYIALLILLISWVNYINLATAGAAERAKEVAIRKSLGSRKAQIVYQFLVEALILNVLAILIAIGILWLVIPYFNELLKIPNLNYLFSQPKLLIILMGIPTIGVFISGLYPALMMSSFKALDVLKTKTSTSPASALIRKLLVGFQFSISMLLISATIIMIHQSEFMLKKDLGVEMGDKLIINKPRFVKWEDYLNNFSLFRDRLATIPGVSNVSSSAGLPSVVVGWLAAWRIEDGMETQQSFNENGIDKYYISNFGIELVAGRNFEQDHKIQPNEVIISEKVSKKLGYSSVEESIGRKIGVELQNDKEFTIVGVTKDYSYFNLKHEARGLLFMKNIGSFQAPNFFSLKLDGSRGITEIEQDARVIFNDLYSADIFESSLLKDKYIMSYEEEVDQQNIFKIFSSIAIFLAIIGVIGLASFIAQLKIKEVSIRKVLGASVSDISWLLSKEFLMVVLMATIIVIPLAIYLMQEWLQDYPYRISIAPWHFLISICIVMFITSLVVVFNMLRVLKVAPSEALKMNE